MIYLIYNFKLIIELENNKVLRNCLKRYTFINN